MQHARTDDLDRPDLDAGLLALVDLVRGVERQQSRRLDLGVTLEHVRLHELLLGERLAERRALVESVAQQLVGALGLAEPSHAVEDPAGAQPLLGDHEPVTTRTEEVLDRHPQVGELQFVVTVVDAQHRGVAHDSVAGRVGRNDDHREGQVRTDRLILGAAHDRRVGRLRRTGREPFPAVDHPLVTVEQRGRLQLGGIGAGDIGLGHREARRDVGVRQRLQVAVADRSVGVRVQHQRVLERVRAERQLPELTAALDLVHVHVVHEGQATAAQLLRMAECPQALGLRLRLELLQLRPRLLGALVQHGLGGLDPFEHERQDCVADGTDVFRYFERHPADRSPCLTASVLQSGPCRGESAGQKRRGSGAGQVRTGVRSIVVATNGEVTARTSAL